MLREQAEHMDTPDRVIIAAPKLLRRRGRPHMDLQRSHHDTATPGALHAITSSAVGSAEGRDAFPIQSAALAAGKLERLKHAYACHGI